MREQYEIQGGNFDKAGEISSEIKVILRDLGISASSIRRAVVVAFEAEMNVVMYARKGTLTFILTEDEVNLDIRDEGPGIPDLELAFQEGYTTASDEMRELGFGFGMGLPNMKRNSDELRIETEVGKGTSVLARIRMNAHD
ncbi:MAG: ATP-binding protein [Candidatus Aminicenantes bacterium]